METRLTSWPSRKSLWDSSRRTLVINRLMESPLNPFNRLLRVLLLTPIMLATNSAVRSGFLKLPSRKYFNLLRKSCGAPTEIPISRFPVLLDKPSSIYIEVGFSIHNRLSELNQMLSIMTQCSTLLDQNGRFWGLRVCQVTN